MLISSARRCREQWTVLPSGPTGWRPTNGGRRWAVGARLYQIVEFFLRHLKTNSAAIILLRCPRRIVCGVLRARGREEIIESHGKIRVVRLGTPRKPKEELVTSAPCAGRRAASAKPNMLQRNYFDVWLPELAPSAPLVAYALSEPLTAKRWAVLARTAVPARNA